MSLFPLFIDLNNQSVLIIGGGHVALGKAQKLSCFGARLTVISPEMLPELQHLADTALLRTFQPEDITAIHPKLVIAATSDHDTNCIISDCCKEAGLPVNVVDQPDLCTFQFPSLISHGDLTVSISTSGKSPTAAAGLRRMIECQLPDDIDQTLDGMERLRQHLKARVPEQAQRASLLRRCWNYASVYGSMPDDKQLDCWLSGKTGFVALVGAGCGKADLITLRGLRLLTSCDAIVYDALIDPKLLNLAPQAKRFPVGKRGGQPSIHQEDINSLLITLALDGLNVVRLKGGDPYLFGRGAEEAKALEDAGIPWEEVPGIPSAIGIPAEYSIAVTSRNDSAGLHIITAHRKDGSLPDDLPLLAGLHGTLVFLMGLSRITELCNGLITYGKPAETPAAVLSGGCAPEHACIRGTLSDIAEKAILADVKAPAVIVIGTIAAMDLRREASNE